MSMFISRSCQIGIQAILYVARQKSDGFVPIKKIAEDTELSFHFLGKILQTLTKKGLLHSYKGPNGGVTLARKTDSVTLLDVVEAIDGLDFYKKCLIGLPTCGDESPCSIHHQWGKIREEIFRMMADTTIEDLIHEG